MGSEQGWNKSNDGTSSFQPTEPALCANGCGFFGTAATMNLCSKCYRDLQIKEEQAASAKAAVEKSLNLSPTLVVQNQTQIVEIKAETLASSSSVSSGQEEDLKVVNRCVSCKKKVGLMGIKCRCGGTFCGTHRYPEIHGCTFDYKALGRDELVKANPVIKADKVDNRI